ncbi:MAG: hypothetical protein FIB07_11280 [Candidatus Methanoperedens sp.]|nr:hypothetical protein [Candidatus Methanoperedens sp.]
MAIGLGDIYEKLKELVTITDKVWENTDRIVKLEEEFRAYREESRLSDAELKGDIREILTRLDRTVYHKFFILQAASTTLSIPL